MLYFIPAAAKPLWFPHGAIIAPAHKHGPGKVSDRPWIGDNSAFSGSYSDAKFYAFLDRMRPYQATCRFVVAPDVVGDSASTFALWWQHAPRIRALGYRVAYVAQDGSEQRALPVCDAVFIGGTTDWKLGVGAREVIRWAKLDGRWIHVGRVNSARRYRYFQLLGADSCDGTCAIIAPDREAKNIERWTSQPALFTLED